MYYFLSIGTRERGWEANEAVFLVNGFTAPQFLILGTRRLFSPLKPLTTAVANVYFQFR